MYVKLDSEIINTLCCPLCKKPLALKSQKFVCENCASEYPSHDFKKNESEDKIFDFRIHTPDYCMLGGSASWFNVQKSWEECYFERYSKLDDFDGYLDEIDSVKQVYAEEFNIKGKVLDVGGGEGTLRHFLQPDDDVASYVCVDPTINVFWNFESRPNLLKVYPSLTKPCNFLACYAENLPFAENTFDWVHMRSVLDHFQNPYLAIKEAYRVLKPGGILLIGLTVYGGKSSSKTKENLISKAIYKFRIAGFKSLVETAVKQILKVKGWETIHTFNWKYEDLINLLHITKFAVLKEHWQKPPFTMVVWLQANKLV